MKASSKVAVVACVIYFLLFLLSYLYFYMRQEHDKFAGIFLIIFTAPWTEIFILVRVKLSIEANVGFLEATIIAWVSALINLALIVLLSRKFLSGESKDANHSGS